ncbi:uncharacterized protein METZ01_LOCUS420656, partial [marine metagenome]
LRGALLPQAVRSADRHAQPADAAAHGGGRTHRPRRHSLQRGAKLAPWVVGGESQRGSRRRGGHLADGACPRGHAVSAVRCRTPARQHPNRRHRRRRPFHRGSDERRCPAGGAPQRTPDADQPLCRRLLLALPCRRIGCALAYRPGQQATHQGWSRARTGGGLRGAGRRI